MAKIETTNAVKHPTPSIATSLFVIPTPSWKKSKSLSALAPNITGIARKKVNSAATYLDTPKSNAPIIVAPEREVPGTNDKT